MCFRNSMICQETPNGLISLRGTFIGSFLSMKCLKQEEAMGKCFLWRGHVCLNGMKVIAKFNIIYVLVCRQQDLFRVLKAYTLHRPEEGYCQAQAPIAAVLLMHMPAEVNTLIKNECISTVFIARLLLHFIHKTFWLLFFSLSVSHATVVCYN